MKTEEEIEKMIDDLKQMNTKGDWDRGYAKGRISSLEWLLEDAPRENIQFIRIPQPNRLEWVLKGEKEHPNVIEFVRDYKKLHCPTGGIFTTIRRDNDENAERFEDKEGQVFQVKVEGKDVFKARLLLYSGPDGVRLPYLPDAFLDYDTEGDIHELKARYGRGKVVLLIFKRIE